MGIDMPALKWYFRCKHCFNPSEINPKLQVSFRELYDMHRSRLLWLTDNGYRVHIKWECAFRQEIADNDELKEFMESDLRMKPPLDPRASFFGGRTNSLKLHHVCSHPEEETIKYADINGLYPYVNKNGTYPIGHPEIFVGTEIDQNRLADYYGLMFCRILPPHRIYHPVLPMRIDNKLMFVTCRSCAEAKSNGPCQHSAQERWLEGVWTTDEVNLAVSKGYRVIDVFEVWHYTERSNQLFAGYINTFLAIKQAAKGYPAGVETDEDKDAYINAYEQDEGVRLDKDAIAKNKGLYQVAKICLNSFWGKFGQREGLGKIELVYEDQRFWQLMTSTSTTINSVIFHGDVCA